MHEINIIGNLTQDPVTKTTKSGKTVCEFGVAVNKKGKDAGADFYTINAWEKLGETCQNFLAKGRKVFIRGEPYYSPYIKDGEARCQLNISAEKVEFLSSKSMDDASRMPHEPGENDGYTEVAGFDLPF